MPQHRRVFDESVYVPGHFKQFEQPLRFCNGSPLGSPGDACQVFKAEVVGSGQIYAVKLYKPYSREQMAVDKVRLRRKGYDVSDKALENYFHPWHRESRAYEHMDRHIPYPARQFFPVYYGTTLVPFSSVPAYWTRTMPYEENVPVVVLELLEGPRSYKESGDLQVSERSLKMAKGLHSQLGDDPVHAFIHLMNLVETLHSAKIIHGDIKSDAFADYATTGGPVMYDFSLSWVSVIGTPCLDPFHRKPRSFSDQSNRERKDVECMVSTDYAVLQKKTPVLGDCKKCCEVMNRIRKG